MTVTYKWRNLAEVATYFEERGKQNRRALELYSGRPKSLRAVELRVEAAAYENVAHVLRDTELTG